MKERIITWALALLCIGSFAWAAEKIIDGDLHLFYTAPAVIFTDSNCTDKDDNAKIYANATDTGSGTEDVDVYFQQQIAGTLTTWLHADADGNIDFQNRNITTTGTMTASGGFGATTVSGVFTVNPDGTNEVFQVNDGSLDFTDGNAGTTGTLTVDASGNWSYNKNIVSTGNVAGATYASDGSVLDAELKYINTLSSNAQDQLDARCLESVFGTAISTGLVLDGTDLKAHAALQSIAGLTETNGGIPYGTADNAYAWLAAGAEGTLLMGNGAAAPSWLAAGATTTILVGGGAADPVWTTATGTGAPVRAGSPTFTTTIVTPSITPAADFELIQNSVQPFTSVAASAVDNTLYLKEGNVGIGTTTPDAATKLDVVGAIRASTGILFGTDTAAANTLDDYEEGTYTPTLTCSTSGNFVLDTGADTLSYTKIGRAVHVHGYIGIASDNSCSGTLRVSLPFTASNLGEGASYGYSTLRIKDHGGTITNDFASIFPSSAYAYVYMISDAGTEGAVTDALVDTAFTINMGFTYTTP